MLQFCLNNAQCRAEVSELNGIDTLGESDSADKLQSLVLQ